MATQEITNNAESEELEQSPRLVNESRSIKILKGHQPDPPREKRERTAAQIAAFERARDSRAKNLAKREADAKRLAEYDAMLLRQKLAEKADRIKVKTMKKIEAIESVPSDDEEVIERTAAPPAPRAKPEPKPVPKPEPPKPAPKKLVPYKFV